MNKQNEAKAMKMGIFGNKKLWILLVGIILLVYLSIKFTVGFPLVSESEIAANGLTNSFNVGDTIQLLKDKEVDEIYIWIIKDDYKELPKGYEPSKLKRISDHQLLSQIKSKLNFIYTGGDVATCESKIFFMSKGKVIFKSNLLMSSDRFGLQSKYGWIQSINHDALTKLISKAEPVNQLYKRL